jgi:hypothetical protein
MTRLLPVVALVAAFALLPGSALAQERRAIGNGTVDVVIGWDVEPAYEGMKNAASIRISQGGSDPPVPITGAEKTLKVQMRQGAATKEFPLRAVFGQQGYYVADIVPTREGDYQWTFVGTIGEAQVNEKFDSADGKFDRVEPQTALQFPATLPDASVLTAGVGSAQSEAQQSRTLALASIVLGLLGLLVAVGVWFMGPRARTGGSGN